jgi:formate transporter
MDYLKPDEVAKNMLKTAVSKASLSVSDFLIRGFLSGALLGFGTCLAFTASKQTTFPIVGALIFPVGFVLIVLLGLELVTGNFALLPVAYQCQANHRSATLGQSWLCLSGQSFGECLLWWNVCPHALAHFDAANDDWSPAHCRRGSKNNRLRIAWF